MSPGGVSKWEASDFDGDPPVDHLIPMILVFEPTGAIKTTWRDVAPLELSALNEEAQFTGPCEDRIASRLGQRDRR